MGKILFIHVFSLYLLAQTQLEEINNKLLKIQNKILVLEEHKIKSLFNDPTMSTKEELAYIKKIKILDLEFLSKANNKYLSFKFKNTANKMVNKLEYVIYYLDKNNKSFYEQRQKIKEIKPNYVFLHLNKIPNFKKMWNGKVKIEIQTLSLVNYYHISSRNSFIFNENILKKIKEPKIWYVIESFDDMTDQKTVKIFNRDRNNDMNSIKPSLHINCKYGYQAQVYINWDTYLSNELDILSRFDKKNPKKLNWQYSRDKKATLYLDNEQKLIKKFIRYNKFINKIKDNKGRYITATFNLKGFAKIIKKHKDICRIK